MVKVKVKVKVGECQWPLLSSQRQACRLNNRFQHRATKLSTELWVVMVHFVPWWSWPLTFRHGRAARCVHRARSHNVVKLSNWQTTEIIAQWTHATVASGHETRQILLGALTDSNRQTRYLWPCIRQNQFCSLTKRSKSGFDTSLWEPVDSFSWAMANSTTKFAIRTARVPSFSHSVRLCVCFDVFQHNFYFFILLHFMLYCILYCIA